MKLISCARECNELEEFSLSFFHIDCFVKQINLNCISCQGEDICPLEMAANARFHLSRLIVFKLFPRTNFFKLFQHICGVLTATF